jgi:hypothetical protein
MSVHCNADSHGTAHEFIHIVERYSSWFYSCLGGHPDTDQHADTDDRAEQSFAERHKKRQRINARDITLGKPWFECSALNAAGDSGVRHAIKSQDEGGHLWTLLSGVPLTWSMR